MGAHYFFFRIKMTSNIPPKIVFGYTRVSTDMQVKEGQSLESQQKDIFRYCEYNKLQFGQLFCDEGISGGTMDRPQLKQMLDQLHPGVVVVCVSLSRLSRSVKQFQDIFEIIRTKGAHLVLLDMGVDTTTGVGKLMLDISSALSEFERSQISERTSRVMQNMSRGKTLRTKPKYGFMYQNEQLIPHPGEQEIILSIKQFIIDDPQISDTLIARNLESLGVKLRKSKRIYPNAIKNIILEHNLRRSDS